MENGEWKITDGFELIRPLDRGRGRVWLARDKALRREVALKFQADATDAARAALLREADILARCDHPSIVPFYRTVAPDPPAPAFYVMKALPPTFQPFNPSTFQPFNQAAFAALASALAYLHGLSPPVAHGGVSPDNILLDIGGRAVLAGFGSAHEVADGAEGAMADDVLALGRVLEKVLESGGIRAGRRMGPIVARMLAEDRARRPSAAEVTAALGEPPPRRRPLWLAATGAIAAALAMAVFAPARDEAVVDEAVSPLFMSEPTLQSRLPDFSSEKIGRIPWYRYANPEAWGTEKARVFPGMRRILRLPGDVQIEMAGISKGYFRRGFFLSSNSVEREEWRPAPEAVLVSRPYWIARTELTRAQYAAVMRRAPAVAGHPARRLLPWEGRGGRPLGIEGGDMPVGEDLDLAHVLRFIDKLNKLCKLEGERRFRLPTEAEWELACNALTARHFEGEKDPLDAAWTRENGGGTPHPVAQKAQNPFGLFDMHGNLAEWCADAYAPLGEWVKPDPLVEPASNSAPRVVRGGSFRDAEADCDSNARAAALPTDKGHAIRLVAGP